MRLFIEALEEMKSEKETEVFEEFMTRPENAVQNSLSGMFDVLSKICKIALRPVVLMVDEVDSASNN